MQELEKILEEIDAHAIEFEAFGISDDYISVGWVKEIIRKHMNDGWIPVEEWMPEEDGTYLCTLDGELCGIEEPFTGMCGIEDGIWVEPDCVLAWRPLPDPYRPKVTKR